MRGATGRMLSAQTVTQPGTHCSHRGEGPRASRYPISVGGQLGAQTSSITPSLPGPRSAASSWMGLPRPEPLTGDRVAVGSCVGVSWCPLWGGGTVLKAFPCPKGCPPCEPLTPPRPHPPGHLGGGDQASGLQSSPSPQRCGEPALASLGPRANPHSRGV